MLRHDFYFVLIEGSVAEATVKKTIEILKERKLREKITQRNYEIARDNYSFESLLEKLKSVI